MNNNIQNEKPSETERFRSEITIINDAPLMYELFGRLTFFVTELLKKSDPSSNTRGFFGRMRTPGWSKVRVAGLFDENDPDLIPVYLMFKNTSNGNIAVHAPGSVYDFDGLKEALDIEG